MTVTLNFDKTSSRLVGIEDTVPGCAYIEPDDPYTVYICNPYQDLRLVSLCGEYMIFDAFKDRMFEEVDLDIVVKRK